MNLNYRSCRTSIPRKRRGKHTHTHTHLLTEYVAQQLIDVQPTIIFQQDGAPPLWGLRVRQFLKEAKDLKQRISNAIDTIDEAMVQRTWQEIEYRLDVLRVTNGAHIEM